MILIGAGFRDIAFSLGRNEEGSHSTADLRGCTRTQKGRCVILLSASDPSFQRGPHFPVMGAVVFFASAHTGHDLNINSGPQVVGERVMVLRVIAAEDANLLQLVQCADDLLKGAIDPGPRLVNPSLGFV